MDPVITELVKQVLNAIGIATVPVLGPLVSAALGTILSSVLPKLSKDLVIQIVGFYLKKTTDMKVDTVTKATTALKGLLDNPDTFTAAQAQKIEDDFDKSAVDLIHIRNGQL